MSRTRTPARQTPDAMSGGARLLSRPVLAGLVAVLAVACAALGYLVASGKFGNSTQYLSITTCKIGVAGCEARAPVNAHADFAMFLNGEPVDFTQPQFASTDEADVSFDPGAKSVAVHRDLATWDSFFRTIHVQLVDATLPGGTIEATCLTMPSGDKYCNNKTDTFKFYVNGVQVDGIDNSNIGDLDQVLVSYGPETPEQVVANQLPKVTANACQLSDRCATATP